MDLPILELVLVGLAVVLIVIAVRRLARAMKIRADQARSSLAERGYVIEATRIKGVGNLTRIWGKLENPTPFYLHITNLDPVEALAGSLGIGDLKIGYPDFDSVFVIRSSHPDEARRLLDDGTRRLLLARKKLRFRTGSIDSLFGADYFPEIRDTRDLRDYWSLEVGGNPGEVDTDALLALGRRLAAGVNAASGLITNADPSKLKTGFFEGR